MNYRIVRCCLAGLGLFLPAISHAQAQFKYNIAPFAGTGTAGFAGDGAAAASAQLSDPLGVALDASGNLLIADQLNNRVRKVSAGNIGTVAGNGNASLSGDAGAAASAGVVNPSSVAVDKSGNLYIADPINEVVRVVNSSGTINKFAGTVGTAGYGGDTAAASSALLSRPVGVAVDANGNVYIADAGNNRVRKVGTDGNINTLAGTGAAGRYGDGGPATSAELNNPVSVAVDAAGNVYIGEAGSNTIRKVTTDGNISTFAGSGAAGFSGDGGPAALAELWYPAAIAVDAAGNMYIADRNNNRVRKIGTNGIIQTIAGNGKFANTGDGGPATSAAMQFPAGVAVDSAGLVYVSDAQNNRVRVLAPAPGVAPSINAGGIVNATSFGGGATIAPGTWIEIYGQNLAALPQGWFIDRNGMAPTTLGGVGVTIGGQPAFLSYVSPTQVNAQVPMSVTPGQQTVIVANNVGTSNSIALNVAATQPLLFAPAMFAIGGKQYAGAVTPDGSTFFLPAGAVSGINSRPAHAGETIVLYGIGFGPVVPAVNAGQTAPAATALAAQAQFFFGGTLASTSYSGLAPGAIGLYQFNVVVPAVTPGDAVPLTFTVGGAQAPQTLYVAVQ